MASIFDTDLPRNAANYVPLSPLSFLRKAAQVHGEKTAIVHGEVRRDWAQTYARCKRLASALRNWGVQRGDTVAAMLPNTPAMVEMHFGPAMLGAVLNTLNTRLDAETLAFMLPWRSEGAGQRPRVRAGDRQGLDPVQAQAAGDRRR